ncbi:hypothetical protein MON38_17290 [Hymenobacter sp. DH14]|uniref:Uncharacterized protein n=1 Tax=Hymenobacter cyanobacteriorum TaxID=2926463 RepID=A0A9X1VHX6_9BACT|nr:hypothetical protein [Hymenobacter cyanobacteriorum]MCI1189181.1 hypothetical protein [Hymenobacter cyanobacteriorum]
MKRTFYPFLLTLLTAACQQQKPTGQTASASLAPPDAGLSAAASKPVAQAVAPADSLTVEMRATLRQVDLSKLLLAPQPGFSMALDGFFGTNPQRLSLAILQASRDSLRPELVHIRGKARWQKQVTSFTGDICFTRLSDYFDQGLLLSQGEESFVQDTVGEAGNIINARAYSASATFRLLSEAPASYVLVGETLLDFWLTDKGITGLIHSPAEGAILEKAPTKGSGLLLSGRWQNAADKVGRPFLVSSDVFLLSPGLIKDFGIGDRGAQVNPKYAKLGWNNYWENDEWWVDSPKPKLNL